jgi:hypothetical protein
MSNSNPSEQYKSEAEAEAEAEVEAETLENKSNKKCYGRYIYSIFHIIMTLIAVYLTHKCNQKFELTHLIVAIFFPYIYIIYIISTKGTCENIIK